MAEGIPEERELDDSEDLPKVLFISTIDEWYSNIDFFFTYGECPQHLSFKENRSIKLKAAKFVLWDTGFNKRAIDALPLRLVIVEEPFWQWDIDFIGVINPSSSVGQSFLKENIISRFGVPYKIVTGNAATFSSSEITQFYFEYGILLTHSSDYYPQGNGQAESSNKNVITIIRKLVEENQRSWNKVLYDALWVDKIRPKRAIGMSPFQLLYGINVEIPVTLELPALKLAKAIEDQTFENDLDKRIMYLSQLEEQRTQVVDQIAQHQQVKVLFEKKVKKRGFQVGDSVLLWDKRREPKGLHGKFNSLARTLHYSLYCWRR
ncbi:uncharacterized protein LOC131032281 [Cryptomeria japonica]|uniref:uncharacterized protein LOC131032281 n=1 Tax=Cryptomeria japonica TaxID=3369 RepID=UPI0027DA0C8E|nr:uncharacterized protein LOC131032281 [Cryptomeria japonica]